MQALLAAVRGACSPAVWSRGVELSRSGAVTGEKTRGDEVELRVSTQGGLVAPVVTLWPADAEWSCDCPSRDDACVHVAAAVIALNRARLDGKPLSEGQAPVSRLTYRFTRAPGGLALDRYLVHSGGEQRLELTLAAMSQGRGPAFVASRTDLAVEVLLGSRSRGVMAWRLMSKLLALLVDCPAVELEGKPVTVGDAKPVMRAQLRQRPEGGLILSLVQDPAITEVFENGAVLVGGVLRAVEDPKLSDREMEELRRGQVFRDDDMARLVTQILPSLKQRVPVDVANVALPETARTPPRIVLETSREGDALTVLPTLVYGTPPTARVDAGELRHLGGPVPIRDTQAEARLVARLHDSLQMEVGRRITARGEAAGVKLAQRLHDWQGPVQGDGHTAFFVAPALVPQLRIDGQHFDISFESADGQRTHGKADATAVLRAWAAGQGMVQLMEGGWAPLPRGWLAKHGQRVLDLLQAKDAQDEVPAHALPDLARLCDDLNHPKPPALARLQAQLQNFDGIVDAQLPGDLTAQLRDYQRRGVNWLAFLRSTGMGAMLADDMGLGKTLQALCAIEGRTLVVAPTSVLHNWADEARRFRPSLRVSTYHGAGRQLDPQADLTLTTYAIMRLDAVTLSALTWDTVVLDEAQTIKNPDSQVAQAAYGLQAKSRITLTGTPVENRLEELWSQFHFLNRGLLGGRKDFQERYAGPIAAAEPGVAARLRERIRPFMLRRLKREVAPELPPRTDGVLRCTLGEAERSVYDAVRAATMKDVVAKLQEGGSVLAALEALLRLRQAACHSALIPGQTADSSAKIELLMETLDETLAEGHKALVFSQWTGLLDLIEPHFTAANIPFCRLDGSTPDRGAVVREFQADSGPPVMLVSLKAGGTGLNLTAADHVFLMDPWWNPAVEDQAADRAHRIGQERPVFVHRLMAEDTVEERILALQDEKRAVAQAALEGSDRGASLSRDDLLALLS